MTQLLVKTIANFQTQLAATAAVGATSLTLQSATDLDGIALPTATYGMTVDEGSSTEEHFTATVTGVNLTNVQHVTRGTGVGTSGLALAHRLGAQVKITDHPAIKRIMNVLDGTTDFDAGTPLEYDGTASITTDNQLATKAYADGLAIAGAPDATTSIKGIARISVAPASPTIPITVGDNDPRVPTQAENDAMVGTSGAPSTSNKYVTNDDVSNAGVADKVVRLSGTSYPAGDGSALTNVDATVLEGWFGDGSNGNVVISSNTSLSADMYYNNLTVDNGFTLTTNGYRIFIKGTLDNNGTISHNGGAGGAGNTQGAVGTAGAAAAAGTLAAGAIGKIGGNFLGSPNPGVAGAAANPSLGSNGVAGGAGGLGITGAGAAGGAAGTATGESAKPVVETTIDAMTAGSTDTLQILALVKGSVSGENLSSSAGSGSGGCGATDGGSNFYGTGGGSAGSGGIVFISAKTFDNTGATISANGGAGGAGGAAGTNAGGGGGGGGGTGGVIILIYETLTNIGTVQAAGGAGGAGGTIGGGTSSAGTAGTTGDAGKIYRWLVQF